MHAIGFDITEALLEMHFHRAMVECFSRVFGARFLRLLKPSSQRESWLGFDQGWLRTELSNQQFFDELQTGIETRATNQVRLYLGYFLQFKVVHEMVRRSKYSPAGIVAPYYRAELSLSQNPRTGLSQHETLLRLSRINHALVYYACPMLFDASFVYDTPDLDKLQIVDVSSAPELWRDDHQHFIVFCSDKDPAPLWCSEPQVGKAMTFNEFAGITGSPRLAPLSADKLFNLINSTFDMIVKLDNRSKSGNDAISRRGMAELLIRKPTRILPESFTIIALEKNHDDKREA